MRLKRTDIIAAASAVLVAGTAIGAATSQPVPEMKAVLDALTSLGGKPIETLTPAEARRQPTPVDAVKKVLQQQGKPATQEAVANVEDRMVPGAAGPIPIRIYTPSGTGPFPVLFYIHGGGWVLANLDTYDASARALTNAAGAVVVSTHYRQAPEHPYPAAHDDVFATYQWTLKNASSINGDESKVAIAGESAGGNMAAVVSMRARDSGVTLPVHQLLVYPVAGSDMNTESYRENANARPLNTPMMEWFAKHYFGTRAIGNAELELSKANLKGLPATTIITADIDPLRTDGQNLAKALQAAGVGVSSRNYEGSAHEFFGMTAVLPDAKDAVAFAAAELKRSFASTRAVTGTSGRQPR